MLTRVVASVLAFVWQRVSVEKTVYNSSAYAFEAAADTMLLHLLLRTDHGLDLPAAVTLIAVLAAVDQFIGVLVLVMIRVHDGPLGRAMLSTCSLPPFVLSVTSSMFALGLIICFEQGTSVPWSPSCWWSSSCPATARTRRPTSPPLTGAVHEFVTGGVGAQSLESLAEELLSRIRRLLRAARRGHDQREQRRQRLPSSSVTR